MKKKRNTSRKTRWLITGILVLAVAGSAAFYYYTGPTQTAVPTEAPMQTATAFRGSIILQANGTGTLTPANEVSFGFGTSGQITELDIKVGDQVEAGQLIGMIDDTEAKAAYEQAKRNLADLTTPAAIAEAQQAVAQAEVDIYNAKQDLEYLISSDVFYWENQVNSAEDALKTAQADGGTNPTADQQKKIDDAQTNLDRAQTNLEAAKVKYVNEYVPDTFTYTVSREETVNQKVTTVTTTEVVNPSDAEIAAARAAYQLAIEKQKEAQAYLDLLNGKTLPEDVPGSSLTSLVDAQNALQTAEDNLAATQLISPITGTVTDLTASIGDFVSVSSIVTVADLSQPYTVDAYFDAEDWSSIQTGFEVDVVFDIIPDNTYTGKVTVVYPELDSSSNASLVHAIVKLDDMVDSSLPMGASSSVDVTSGRAENVVLIPVDALHEANPGQYAVFVMENGKLRLRVVDVGLKDLINAEIKSGVQVGDVVTTGITAVQ